MKWPRHLIIIRHAESAYNALRAQKAQSDLYKEFVAEFEANAHSDRTYQLALMVKDQFALGCSDYATPLSKRGEEQAYLTGMGLEEKGFPKPDVIFISPYARTNGTFQNLVAGGWDTAGAKEVQEDRIREQEHGLSLLYSDWRVFHALHPDQAALFAQLGPYWYQFPQGESVSMVRDRVRSFMNVVVREHSEQVVYLISHHLTKLSIRSLLERWSPEEFIRVDQEEKPVNCSITHYVGDPHIGADGKLVLEEYNTQLW